MERRVHSAKHIEKVCKKSAGKTKSPCVTLSRCSTGAFVVFGVQVFNNLPLPVGQFSDFGGSVQAGKGLFGGGFAGCCKRAQRCGYDFEKS